MVEQRRGPLGGRITAMENIAANPRLDAFAPKRLAKLTAEENRAWELAFADYHDSHGQASDAEADQFAWLAVCAEFPRLKDFDGAEP